MGKRRGKGNVSKKNKSHSKAKFERALKKAKQKIGPFGDDNCFVISRTRNVEDITLDGKTMDMIPLEYLVLDKNKIAIEDRSTKELVLVLLFTKFEDIESSQEYNDFEKLTMSLAKLRKGRSGYIANNKAQLTGKMFALGWRGATDRGYTMGYYVPGRSIQTSESSIMQWERDQVELVKWIANFYESKFMKLAPNIYKQAVGEAIQLGVPLLGQTEFTNLEQDSIGFSSNLTYTLDDFSNNFHQDQDSSSYAYGIWAPTFEKNGKLARLVDGFQCEGGHFIVPSYNLYVDFGKCDGIVEIIWRANSDFHATSKSKTLEGFTRIGTSTQIAKSLVDRVKSLTLSKKHGEDVNLKISGLKDIIKEKTCKLNEDR